MIVDFLWYKSTSRLILVWVWHFAPKAFDSISKLTTKVIFQYQHLTTTVLHPEICIQSSSLGWCFIVCIFL